MRAANNGLSKKERKIRRKKLLRMYREDQQAIMWNKVADEVGFCDLLVLDTKSCSFEDPDSPMDSEFEDMDEDYPNKIEILHNIHECD
jgi:hypothetical protein